MQIFYASNVSEGTAHFSREESGHCLRVLRMRRGENISFTDGKGNLYQGVITGDDASAMTASVTSVRHEAGHEYRLHIAISPVKNDDRLEWFIEKAVETGIDEITPMICSRTEKKRIRKDRLDGLILSAMKQSVRSYLPQLNEPLSFREFIAGERTGKRLIACCDAGIERIMINTAFSPGEEVTVLIGPEGDFTPEEVSLAMQHGFIPVHMGPNRLRTETAGVVACCSVYLANI